MNEEWRPIAAWPDYEVSSLGRVRRATDAYWGKIGARHVRVKAGFVLKSRLNSSGYPSVLFPKGEPKDRKFVNALVSKLVCEAFHGPQPSPLHQAAHDDADILNCRSENLRWATQDEILADKLRRGTTGRGEDHREAKLSREQVAQVRALLAGGVSQAALAADFGVHKNTIWAIKAGRSWGWLKTGEPPVGLAADVPGQ